LHGHNIARESRDDWDLRFIAYEEGCFFYDASTPPHRSLVDLWLGIAQGLILKAKSLKLLARPTGIEPVFPP
jgi:hypothetical protein